jgi:hypothetical protein
MNTPPPLRSGLLGAALLLSALLASAASDRAPAHPSVAALPLTRVKVMPTGAVIGTLTANTTIDGQPCAKGWLHLHPNGRLQSCRLAEPFERDGRRYERGRRLTFDDTGRVVAP